MTLGLLSVALLGAGVLWRSQAQVSPGPDGLLTQLAVQSGDVALVAYGVRADGTPDPAQPSVLVNADQPMPLASTRKIVLLAAYARAVSHRTLAPQQTVSLAEWETYFLPGTDGGAHEAALRRLKLPSKTATLDQLAGAMIRESDNAAADLIYAKVGPLAIDAVIRDAGLQGQEALFPISGEFWTYASAPVDRLLTLSRSAFRAEALKRAPRPGSRPATPPLPGVADQARLADVFTVRGTARDYAGLMARVMTGTFLSKDVSALMARHLEWPMDANQGNADAFQTLGAKGGSLPGVYTNNFYLWPKVGPAAGQRRVVSLFMRRIPEAQYAERLNVAENFMLMTAIRPDFAAKVRAALKGEPFQP